MRDVVVYDVVNKQGRVQRRYVGARLDARPRDNRASRDATVALLILPGPSFRYPLRKKSKVIPVKSLCSSPVFENAVIQMENRKRAERLPEAGCRAHTVWRAESDKM